MRELLEKIANTAIRVRKGSVYFFDKEGIYRSVSLEEGKKMMLQYLIARDDGSLYLETDKIGYITGTNNITISKKAICKLQVGDRIEKLEYYLKTVKIEHHVKQEGLERFITKIENPVYISSPESPDNVFDYIFVDVNVLSEWTQDRMDYIRKHKKKILEKVINKVENDKEFKRYEIPIQILRVSKITLTKSSVLQVILEMKKIK